MFSWKDGSVLEWNINGGDVVVGDISERWRFAICSPQMVGGDGEFRAKLRGTATKANDEIGRNGRQSRHRHNGQIERSSPPGRTRCIVSLQKHFSQEQFSTGGARKPKHLCRFW
jgi:hypothetical protein